MSTIIVVECVWVAVMKRSKSYTWLSGLLRPKAEEREEQDHEEWGAVPWVRADVMHHDRSVTFMNSQCYMCYLHNFFIFSDKLKNYVFGVLEVSYLLSPVFLPVLSVVS